MIALLIYVDDIIVTGNNFEEQKQLKESLARTFEMKDLGALKYFLGIEVAYSKKKKFSITEEVYIGFVKGNKIAGR